MIVSKKKEKEKVVVVVVIEVIKGFCPYNTIQEFNSSVMRKACSAKVENYNIFNFQY